MHKRLVLILAALTAMLIVQSAIAQTVITVDEYGNGTAGAAVLPATTGTDPFDPTNGLRPLIYDLTGVGAPTVGDIWLTEPNSPGVYSDLLRFNNGWLIVYSDLGTDGVADVGIPSLAQANSLTLAETGPEGGVNGLFNYTPTPLEPGYIGAACSRRTTFTATCRSPARCFCWPALASDCSCGGGGDPVRP